MTQPAMYPTGGELSNGFATAHRSAVTGSQSAFLGYVWMAGFVCPQTVAVSSIGCYVAGQVVTTDFRLGLYRLAANNDATLIGSSGNAHAVTATIGHKSVPLAGSVLLVADAAYAVGMLCVGDTPLFASTAVSTASSGTENPFLGHYWPAGGGQVALPAAAPAVDQNDATFAFYFDLTR